MKALAYVLRSRRWVKDDAEVEVLNRPQPYDPFEAIHAIHNFAIVTIRLREEIRAVHHRQT